MLFRSWLGGKLTSAGSGLADLFGGGSSGMSGTNNEGINSLIGSNTNNVSYVDPVTGEIIGQSLNPAVGEGE